MKLYHSFKDISTVTRLEHDIYSAISPFFHFLWGHARLTCGAIRSNPCHLLSQSLTWKLFGKCMLVGLQGDANN